MKEKFSEAVSPGHPDKIADQISDTILDLYTKVSPDIRVACETVVSGKEIHLFGEVSFKDAVPDREIEVAIRNLLVDIGYRHANIGFNAFEVEIYNHMNRQSRELQELNPVPEYKGDYKEVLSGDQGIMFGYATNESPDFLPLQYSVARTALKAIQGADFLEYGFYPDSKCFVSVCFPEEPKLPYIKSIFISAHVWNKGLVQVNCKGISDRILRTIRQVYMGYLDFTNDPLIVLNPFEFGGPEADSGLTGRKIVCDQYGGEVPVGGGAFSGKDYTKIDRTLAYWARLLARGLVEKGYCDKALVKLGSWIGLESPTFRDFDTFGTSYRSDEDIREYLEKQVMDLSSIVQKLHLLDGNLAKFTGWGPFGQNPDECFWEDVSVLEN